jgi:glucoamylase
MSALNDSYRWLDDDGPAFGAPGLEPRWTSSKKDAVATAYAASSRIWFTISHGTLNEIYYPTIDRPQTRDMELLFTDGETFFHEEKRDLEYDFHHVDGDALAVRVVATDLGGRYTVTKEFLTDPHHPVVLMNVKIEGDEAVLAKLKCYPLLAPHLDGGGAGNSARSINVAGRRCILAWKNNVSLAFGADCGFSRSSCGYVGSSDGFQDIVTNGKMTWNFGQALNGNLAVMGEIDVAKNREFTIAIALGDGHHSALAGMMQTLSTPYELHRKRYIEQWHRAASPERLASVSTDNGRLMRVSHNTILAHEDKTYSGAFIASASIPWGNAKSDDDLGGYHLVWTRDMVNSVSALVAAGNVHTALRALIFLAVSQHDDGGFAQNFWVNGDAYWNGTQLDEVACPIILAWQLHRLNALADFDPMDMVRKAAAFLIRVGPVTQQERWEEASGYSPSTLASNIVALTCTAALFRERGDAAAAAFIQDQADYLEDHLEEWTVTTTGSLGEGPYYMRILPELAGQENPAEDVESRVLRIANCAPGAIDAFPARDVVDGGFLELVRHGIRAPDDPVVLNTLKIIDAVLKVETPAGPAWHRYNHDGYGQQRDGGPFTSYGIGRVWPLLTGERGHYELAAGRSAEIYLRTMEALASKTCLLCEQAWDEADLPEKHMRLGEPTGSAMPLMWAHAEYVKLLRSSADGNVFDQVPEVAARYLSRAGNPKKLEVWKFNRRVRFMRAGEMLRVIGEARFSLRWTSDNWASAHDLASQANSLGIDYADLIDLATTPGMQIEFTFFWIDANRWEGRNYVIGVVNG